MLPQRCTCLSVNWECERKAELIILNLQTSAWELQTSWVFNLTPGVFNDIAVASALSLRDYPHLCNIQSPILVIDLDVHQVSQTALYSLHFTIHHINWPGILHTKRSEKFIQLFSPCFSNCFFKKKVECLVSLLCFEWICSVLSCDKWFCSGDREMEQQKYLKMMTVWSHSACMGPTIILGGQRWNQTMTLICQITLVMRSIWQFWQNGCHTWLSCMNQAWFSFRFASPFNLPQ